METLEARIVAIKLHNVDDGYTVAVVEDAVNNSHTVVAYLASPLVGCSYRFEGDVAQSKYGLQFNASAADDLVPVDELGIRAFLSSGSIKNVGPVFAKRIVDEFGVDSLRVIKYNPEKLSSVKGMNERMMKIIRAGFKQYEESAEVLAFLRGHDIGPNRAVSVYKKYGEKTVETVSKRPYVLADEIQGIGFDLADKIAATFGIKGNHPSRLIAGIKYAFKLEQMSGHCGVRVADFYKRTSKLLGVNKSDIESVTKRMIQKNHIVVDSYNGDDVLAPGYMNHAEGNIAERLFNLAGDAILKSDIDSAVKSTGFEFSPSQSRASKVLTENKLAIVTGGPGVGKTTMIKTALQSFTGAARGLNVVLTAPTGRAAQRMSETTGLPASTIHRLLGFNGSEYGFNGANKIEADIVVIDEVSMMDVLLSSRLLSAIPDNAHVILVGDKDQLPSVGPGSVVRDLIRSNAIPVALLTEVKRQGSGSGVVKNAHAINSGSMPQEYDDFEIKTSGDKLVLLQILKRMINEDIPRKTGVAPKDIQVLTPSHKGVMGTKNLNYELQGLLNPNPVKKVTRGDQTFGVGDKVMQTRNDYVKNIFNGDSGWVVDVDYDEKTVDIQFDKEVVKYTYSQLNNVSLAWAITIHKSQGSEYPAVIVPVVAEHSRMHARNLLYTAITRGKEYCAIIGDERSISLSVKNNPQPRRISGLVDKIADKFEGCVPHSPEVTTEVYAAEKATNMSAHLLGGNAAGLTAL